MDRERTKTLIDKYFDGTTTNAEEEELRRRTEAPTAPSGSPKGERSRDDFPEEDLRVLKALFAFEEKERATLHGSSPSGRSGGAFTPLPHLQNLQDQPAVSIHGGRGRRLRRLDFFLASAAASAAILFVIATTLPLGGGHPRNYAVIDGKVYTDRATVEQQAEEALMLVASSEDETFDALRTLNIED